MYSFSAYPNSYEIPSIHILLPTKHQILGNKIWTKKSDKLVIGY